MDVIKPDLLWIGSRCYRVNQTVNTASLGGSQLPEKYVEHDAYDDDCVADEENYQIECTNGRYLTAFHVPSQLFGVIVGAKGATRRRIETETSTKIEIPKQGQDGDIKITSNNAKSVSAARRRIEIIVIGARMKMDFTHFLSVPMVEPEIQETFLDFKTKVLGDNEIYGITEKYFQNPHRLHITIVLLTLLDNADRALAAQYLRECEETIVSQFKGLELQMKGLEIMNDDPSAVNVLFAAIESEAMQAMSDQLHEYFCNKGLMQRKNDHVKLHVTLMNTKFLKNQEENSRVEAFDATKILQKYGNFNFGRVKVKEIHLSQRHTSGTVGYYEASCIIKV
ncbi:activating signal cointegrator 1 complex subunit 1 [Culicoides brevitarsis]|uniref:activating signal cointegrator 1 complex subunit 1 n=1 Tax=Culicoides brevitarsis TaxID=469753 RepID=UPI00307B2263